MTNISNKFVKTAALLGFAASSLVWQPMAAIAADELAPLAPYLSALVNFRFVANGLWTTKDTITRLETMN